MGFRSTKIVDGFSTCFRQWRADDTHCSFLHGYSVYFKLTFEGDLDYRNWVADFGFMKRSKTKIAWTLDSATKQYSLDEWFKMMFDHTLVIAEDDPLFTHFLDLYAVNGCQLRILPVVGCEIFAKMVFDVVGMVINAETGGRVKLIQVECFEHEKNSAIYFE